MTKTYGINVDQVYRHGCHKAQRFHCYQFTVEASNKKEAKEIAIELAYDYKLEDLRKDITANKVYDGRTGRKIEIEEQAEMFVKGAVFDVFIF